jgi:hypothetical protein
MTTNVLKLPGNYIIRAVNGIVTVDTPLTLFTGDIEVNEDALIHGNTILGDSPSQTIDANAYFISDLIPREPATYDLGLSGNTWKKLNSEEAEFYSGNNVGNPYDRPYNPADIYDTEAHRRQGSVYVTGGLGIEKDLNVGGYIYGRIDFSNTTTSVRTTATNENFDYYITFVDKVNTPEDITGSPVYVDNTGVVDGLRYNASTGKIITDRARIAETDPAVAVDDATLVVDGGVGIAGNVIIGEDLYVENEIESGDLLPHADAENTSTIYSIGTTSTQWAEAYVHDLYTRIIRSTTGTVQIDPAAGVTEIIGDIRVRGTNPIGTAPVVTNTLYVTMDGNDTNDGRAMDSSRACRTINGALNSPYYQPGTQILVSAGFYLEDNPLRLKPYTSIRGSDIRTTFIEPINKTQDLFHLESGCYLNYMTFLNGRSGLLEGEYDPGFNRGAYATSFPPLEGEDRIDLYHSPYVQNCTNQSGPWLKDGTMFVPNQTVQVPAAVGVGTWPANTTTIVVNVSTGTILQGMAINAGQTNPGFFSARTLMLANKPFLQEQVVAYVDRTFTTGTFVYDSAKCSRDTGLIVDSIAIDMLQDSTSESVFAGLQYWNQNGYVDSIDDQITTATAAISYAKTLAVATATNAASAAEGTVVSDRFDNILAVLNTSTATLVTGEFAEWVTNSIVSNGTASNVTSVIDAYTALIAAKESIQDQTIAYIYTTLTPFTYDSVKYARDTGLIIDAVSQDLLFRGTSQSTFTGLQYWEQTEYPSGIGSEITTTTDAILYIKTIVQEIVQNTTGTRYQSSLEQITSLPAATIDEANILAADLDVILGILNTGTTGVVDIIVPNGIVASTSTDVSRAYQILQTNKKYIQAEAIAHVEFFKTVGFVYDQEKFYQDVGNTIDSISFDLLYGGNRQAVQNGVYYYNFDPLSSAISNQIPQRISAYNYIRELFDKIILSQPVNNPYQLVETQVFGSAATLIEVQQAESKIDVITDIIQNGPEVAEEPSTISLTPYFEPAALQAAQLLQDNKDFIKAEVIAYVDTLNTFLFDEDKYRRDIDFIIDSVAFDLLHGGNKQSFKSGVYYFEFDGNTTAIPNEIPQTTAAYTFIKNILTNIIKAEPIDSSYQLLTTQNTSLPPATDYEVSILKGKIDVITNIIRNGPSVAPDLRPIDLTTNQSSAISNAYNLLVANRQFIQDEVIAYVDTLGNFDYSREFCYRDVGILVENVAYDAAFGGNEKAVESGLAYYDGVVSKIAGQEIQTVAAIDYLNNLIQKVITNTTCTDLLSNGITTTAIQSQVINTVLLDGDVAGPAISSLFNTITTIIDNGPSAAPDVYNGTNADAAFVSAEILMQANRKFIQEDTINYINNLVQQFPYSERKCRRDTGLIIDSIAFDLLYPTPEFSQSTFAGLQYWNQDTYVGDIAVQLQPTLNAIQYLKELSVKIIQNITPADDLVDRYQSTFTQVTSYEPATAVEARIISSNFDVVLEILGGNNTGWTDRIIPNGNPSPILSVYNAVTLLNANKDYLAHEVTAYVNDTTVGFVYDEDKCRRDVKYIVDSVAFDLVHGGNRQSVQAGLYYYGFSTSTITIQNQEIQTTAAFNYLASMIEDVITNAPVFPLQSEAGQVFGSYSASAEDITRVNNAVSTITNIITNGPAGYSPAGITFTSTTSVTSSNAFKSIYANKKFLIEQTIAYIDLTYNPTSFNYDEELCYRDVGLIVDAVSQDILIGGNSKSLEAGLAYWTFGENSIAGQETTTTVAINHARDIALKVIANRPVDPQTGTITTQIINSFFQYGGDYMPQEAVRRNFNIITKIINEGPAMAPPKYLGGGLFALTGVNGSDVLNPPRVVSVSTITDTSYLIGLDSPTIGFGINSTLYFGDTLTFPLSNKLVEAKSLEYTSTSTSWDQRKTDPTGSMGGSLVDGAVISTRSPIQSFVYDAYTQVNQGGRGVHIINDGYAQLVSVFTIFCSVGVQTDSGGIASIVNSNANFGDICLLSKGYGSRKFSGTIYNPPFLAWDSNSNSREPDLDQYYPTGFWPNNAKVLVFVPDLDERPHISLVMEIEPPEGYTNEQGFLGFLNASPTTSTLTTGTITLSPVITDNVAVGNSVFVRDQFGRQYNDDGNRYIPTGTVVTSVGYQSVTLSKALTGGGGEPDNPNYFDLYFCGNAYYTVLSSTPSENPLPVGTNVLSTASTGGTISQVPAHIDAVLYLNTLTNQIISNTSVTVLQTATSQVFGLLVRGGEAAQTFIDLRFGEVISIVGAADLAAAESVIKPALRTKTGPAVQGGGSAISLIQANIEFLADEVDAYVQINYPSLTYDRDKCQRDVKLILRRLIYDIESGGRYNSVLSGLSYWQRDGTHRVVQLGENVTRTDLFPDGATVNFYQRSYMSASGYVFEYVGAGTDYGALPQRGVADPVQGKEVVQLDSGKVFFTSTDQNGDFRIGPGLVISQATGVLSGRTFTRSLFANMTPFILAIEAGQG